MYKDSSLTNLIAQATSGIYISKSLMSGGTITDFSITPDDDEVQAAASYTFKFSLATNLYFDSRIEIFMPTYVTISKTSCTRSLISNNLYRTASCSVNTASKSFIIDTPFQSNSLPSWDYVISTDKSEIEIKIDGAKNPDSERFCGSWKVVTYNKISGSYYQVDSGTASSTSQQFKPVKGSLTGTVSTTSMTTYQDSDLYTFSITLDHDVTKMGYLIISLPSEIEVQSTSLVRSTCYYGSSKTKMTCSVSSSDITMTLSSGHTTTSGNLIASFLGIRNPRTTKTSSVFTIKTTDKDKNTIDTASSLKIQMTKLGSITKLSVSLANYTNGNMTNYTFSLQTSIPILTNDKFNVTFPPEVYLSSTNVKCYVVSGVKTISCTRSTSQVLIVTFTSLSQETGTFIFFVTGVYNPPSTKVSSAFQSLLIKDSSGYSVQQLPTTTKLTVQTTTAANILSYALEQGVLTLNASTLYNVSFTPTNAIPNDGSFVITWPSQVAIDNDVKCTIVTSKTFKNLCDVNVTARTINITEVFKTESDDYSDQISVLLTPVRNPQENKALNGFQINTFADKWQYYPIDILEENILLPKTPCVFPCKTCNSTNTTYCKSCLSDLGFPYLMKYNFTVSTCKQFCDPGFTSNGDTNKSCVACDVSCRTCVDNGKSGDKSRCIACAPDYNYRYSPEQKCMKQCDAGFYQSSPYVCDKCKSPCKSCNGSATTCTECYSSSTFKFLFDKQCVESCPQGFIAIDNTCVKCQSPCLTCLNTTTTCTSCNATSSAKYQFGYSCYNQCPAGTSTNNQTLRCSGCLEGCTLCDSLNQTKCLQCTSPLLNFEGSCISSCPEGFIPNSAGTACTNNIPNELENQTMIPFPHLIASFLMIIVAMGGYIKDRNSLIISNILILLGPIELISYIVQSYYSLIFATYRYAGMSATSVVFYLIFNIAFGLAFEFRISRKDPEFIEWRNSYKKTSIVIMTISYLFSFKMLRLFYSNFYGFNCFNAEFTSPGVFQRQIIIFTILHIITSNCPILAVDAVGLFSLKWGTQLYICMIETCFIALLMVTLSSIELSKLKNYIDDDTPMYKFVNSDSVMNASQMDDAFERKIREEMLRNIMLHAKTNRGDQFINNRLDEIANRFGIRRCRSMIGFENDKEEDPRKAKTNPNSPRAGDGLPFDRNAMLSDNVYAESKPPNPLGKQGKTYVDADTWAQPRDFDKILSRKGGDFVNFESSESQRKRDRKNRRRGRKNQYYTQIDAEDDEEAENIDQDEYQDTEQNLDVIKEEDEEEELKKKQEKKKQQEEEQRKLQEEQKRLQLQAEEEEQKRILAEQEKQKRILAEQEKQRLLATAAEEERKRKEQEAEAEKFRIQQEEEMKKKQQEEQIRLEKEKAEQERMQEEQRQREIEEAKQKQMELDRELQKIEEERIRKEQEEIERKLKEEQEAKRLEEEITAQQQSKMQFQQINDEIFQEQEAVGEGAMTQLKEVKVTPEVGRPQSVGNNSDNKSNGAQQDVVMLEESLMDTFAQQKNDIQIPPDASKRNFNENDILGDFDRDDKGNPIILQDENGNYVDKKGRKVNEKGYLMDPLTGDIIENTQNKKMFDNQDIDERGEIPAPFCVEKHNFNPFNIRGDFDYDRQGRPILSKNKKGELEDKKGRKVNKRGWLIDSSGNIVDRANRKKFDKKQLTQDGDLQKLFTFGGRRFDIMDVSGQFDRDSNGKIVFKQNKNGQNVDNLGRLVNEKGYLIEANGNIVDKDGKKIFDAKYLKNGEFPKIFPYSQFNIKNILGTFEMDPLGNPILDKNQNGELIDRDGRRVNRRGYLIDGNGNVIDKRGKLMFDREILDAEDEIPKVFRTGLLKSDSASSLSRLMSEIEKNQPSDYENEDQAVQRELQRIQQNQQRGHAQEHHEKSAGRLSGNTSVDSMMEDTPSNYNIANQRFDTRAIQNVQNVEQIVEEDSQFGGDFEDNGNIKKRRVKKKRKIEAYRDPSDKDIKMAKAYGGAPRGALQKQIPKAMARNIHTPATLNKKEQHKLQRLTGTISGYQKNESTRDQNEETKFNNFNRQPQNQTHQSNFLNDTNDPSFMAVPEHHIREQRLKQRKLNELKAKKKSKKKLGPGGDPDFEKMFGKDIDEFLEDSDWDIESLENMSNFSKGTSRSAFNDGRIRGLESIYLQRIETSMKKVKGKVPPKKPKFRNMQDRLVDEPNQMGGGFKDHNEYSTSQISQYKPNKNQFAESANTTGLVQNKSDMNIFNKRAPPLYQNYK